MYHLVFIRSLLRDAWVALTLETVWILLLWTRLCDLLSCEAWFLSPWMSLYVSCRDAAATLQGPGASGTFPGPHAPLHWDWVSGLHRSAVTEVLQKEKLPKYYFSLFLQNNLGLFSPICGFVFTYANVIHLSVLEKGLKWHNYFTNHLLGYCKSSSQWGRLQLLELYTDPT